MLNRDDFVKMLSAGKSVSDATMKNRASFLFKLYRDIGSGEDDLSWLNTYSRVVKRINESKSLESRKAYLFHVSALLDTKAGKTVDAKSKQALKAAATRARNASIKRTADNIATPDQVAQYVSVPDMASQLDQSMKRLFDAYKINPLSKKMSAEEYSRWDVPSDRLNIKSFARDLQKNLMIACYVLQPALRSDWSTLEITSTAVNRLSADKNWLQVLRGGRIRIIMNKFKNVKRMGAQQLEVEDPKLKRYLRYWIDLLTRLIGSQPSHLFIWNLSPVKDVSISTTSRKSFSKAVSRASEGILSKKQSINSFRHAHEKHLQRDSTYTDMTVGERDRAHGKLLHSHRTGLLYNWIDRN